MEDVSPPKNNNIVRIISSCPVVPPSRPARRCHLTPWDLIHLSYRYMQRGFLYSNHHHLTTDQLLQRLKSSLAATLGYYYPAAGRLVVEPAHDKSGHVTGTCVSIDCNGQGAEFVHAVADNITVAQVEAVGQDVPSFLPSFFPLDGVVNYDGHTRPLVAVQLTELADGFFVACSYNHCVSDGIALNRFFDAWTEISRTNQSHIDGDGDDDVYDRWFGGNNEHILAAPIVLPYTHHDQFIDTIRAPATRIRIFELSAQSIAVLKGRANEERNPSNITISSFQSVASFVWQAVTRAHALPHDTPTRCLFVADCRSRLQPPVPPSYMGNCTSVAVAKASAAQLVSNGVGFGASLIHELVAGQTDSAIRDWSKKWAEDPVIYKPASVASVGVIVGSSPRFDLHGYDFGWGRAVAVRSGSSNKAPGVCLLYGGREGGGSVEVRICLEPEIMKRLESDQEFLAHVN